ncbi:MAG TPA: GNAT family N-acetyltransferase [Candidatus Onthovicinus excrementipullorum]|nr:GNAT family N-acetyltransferase [Candidatus Onthovicinus excrementipullorum]
MGRLTAEHVTSSHRDLDRVRALYLSAFPREERAPFRLLLMRSRAEYIDFFAFYDSGRFCGIAYLISGERTSALMYLAVEQSARSQGYGAEMLAWIRAYCGARTVALDIEQVIPTADNYEQRKRRRDFYLRNGFRASGCGHTLRNVRYEILASSVDFSPEEYARLMRRFSCGMVRMDIHRYDHSVPPVCTGDQIHTIREARDGDLDALLHLYLHLHEKTFPDQSDTLARTWDSILTALGYHIIVAELEGKIVSSCTCIIIPNLTHGLRPYALIENVVTDEAYRGRGLASACIDYALSVARRAGCYKAMLLTGAKDKKTLNFYRRAGFNSRDKTAFIQWL